VDYKEVEEEWWWRSGRMLRGKGGGRGESYRDGGVGEHVENSC